MPFRILLLITACAILINAPAARADDSLAVGTVTALTGTAQLTREGVETPVDVKEQDPVYPHDQFMTGENTVMAISLIDETMITVGSNGMLAINEYVYDPDKPEEGKARYSLLKTAFMFISGHMAKREDPDVELDLDFGSIGIRGTKIYRGMRDETCWIFLEEGIIRVHNERGYVTLDAGQGTRMSGRNRPPTLPEHWNETDYNWIQEQLGL